MTDWTELTDNTTTWSNAYFGPPTEIELNSNIQLNASVPLNGWGEADSEWTEVAQPTTDWTRES
jgi:hypothetical protein